MHSCVVAGFMQRSQHINPSSGLNEKPFNVAGRAAGARLKPGRRGGDISL